MSTAPPQEARRLVFIRRKDDPPSRRGVAIPIYDHSDWDSFTSKCCEKLKIPGVGAVHLASTGEPITRLDQLQDIDDLVITEVRGCAGGDVTIAGVGARVIVCVQLFWVSVSVKRSSTAA